MQIISTANFFCTKRTIKVSFFAKNNTWEFFHKKVHLLMIAWSIFSNFWGKFGPSFGLCLWNFGPSFEPQHSFNIYHRFDWNIWGCWEETYFYIFVWSLFPWSLVKNFQSLHYYPHFYYQICSLNLTPLVFPFVRL